MHKKIPLKDLEPLIRDALGKGENFPIIPHGQSMLPLLRPGTDTVELSPLPETINPGDIILYKRDDGTFVLHRVMTFKNGIFTFCGDSQTAFEKGIKKEQMIAIVNTFFRDGEKIDLINNSEYLSYKKKLLRQKKFGFALFSLKKTVKKVLKYHAG